MAQERGEKPRKRMGGKRVAPRKYNPWLWLGAIFVGPLAILLCVQLITLGTPAKLFSWFFSSFGAALLTYLFLLSLMILLTALTWKVWISLLIIAIPALILAIVNRLKESINGEPLLLSDFGLAGDAGAIAGFLPEIRLSFWVALGIILAIVGVVIFSRFGWRPKSLVPRWVLRRNVALIALGVMALVLILPLGYYAGSGNETQAERNRRLGLIGGLYSAALNKGGGDVDYDQDSLRDLISTVGGTAAPAESGTAEPEETPEPVRPHVILMMSESFCDPDVMLPGVEFSSDPIPCYHALAEEYPAGDFLSNTYGGGTGSVEMEVFTGVPNVFTKEGEDLTSLKTEGVYGRIPSIIRTFQSSGYQTQFVHNYTTRLYDRVTHFPAIGFDGMTFEEDFPEDAERDKMYLKDTELVEEMIRVFEERDPDQPMLLYGLTMGNHQPYTSEKFAQDSGLDPASGKLNDTALGVVDVLVQGLNGADKALGMLVDHFSQCDEPVMIVFWGDHLPGLYIDDNHTIYSLLDYVPTVDTLQWDAETLKKMLTTPFLVWNNYGAELDVPDVVSNNNLGSHILEWAGVEKPLYFQWQDQVSETILMYRPRLYVAADGTPYKEIPEEDKALMEQYKSVVYDILYGDGIFTEELSGTPETEASEPPGSG